MKTVLLTGAAGALGSVVMKYFLERNFFIHAAIRRVEQKFSLEKDFSQWKENFSFSIADISSDEGAKKFFSEAPENFSSVIHCAGGWQGGKIIEETSAKIFDELFMSNTRSTFLLLHYSLAKLKENSGSFIAISSRIAVHPQEKNSAYAASKAAVTALCLSAAEECRNTNARVNVIAPSTIRTADNLAWADETTAKNFVAPLDIAKTIFYLCSDEAKAVNGAVIPMYGGISA